MLKFIYLLIAMTAVPFVIELVNTRTNIDGPIKNFVKGWPMYIINVIVCAVVALAVCALPGGWEMTFFNWGILLFAIYFGNQFFFNTVIKPLMSHRF